MKIRFKVFPFIPPVHFFLNFSSFSSFLEPFPLLLPPSSKSFLCIYQGSLLPYHHHRHHCSLTLSSLALLHFIFFLLLRPSFPREDIMFQKG